MARQPYDLFVMGSRTYRELIRTTMTTKLPTTAGRITNHTPTHKERIPITYSHRLNASGDGELQTI